MTPELMEYIKEKATAEQMSILNIKNGAALEMVDDELARVCQNISDINTSFEPRKIILEIIMQPSKNDRSFIGIAVKASSKLCGPDPLTGTADIKQDYRGRAIAMERKPKQLEVFDNVKDMTGAKKE